MVVCGQLDQVVGEADPLLFCYSNGLALLVVLLVPEEHRLVSEVSVALQW